MTTKVVLIDNEPVVGAGLRAILDARDDLEVVGEEDQIGTAGRTIATTATDVVLINTRRIGDELFDAITDLAGDYPSPALLLMAPSLSARVVLQAIVSGVDGYLTGSVSAGLVVDAIRTLAHGGMVVSADAGATLFDELAPAATTRGVLGRLTQQEYHVLDLLAAGRSNDEIAVAMVVAPATVKKHLSSLLRKVGARDRLQAGLLGWQLGLGRTLMPRTTSLTSPRALVGR